MSRTQLSACHSCSWYNDCRLAKMTGKLDEVRPLTESHVKAAHITSAAQTEKNRVNQRNFRARRQVYIRELQEEIRTLKEERLQATKEVQTAAREVLEENRKLRWVIERNLGVTGRELDAYLSGVTPQVHQPISNISTSPGHLATPSPKQYTTSTVQNSTSSSACISKQPPRSLDFHESNIAQDITLPNGTSLPPDSFIKNKGDRSCEEAAMIIAGLRSGLSSDEIYSELGCSANKPCAVKNLSVFELLDRG